MKVRSCRSTSVIHPVDNTPSSHHNADIGDTQHNPSPELGSGLTGAPKQNRIGDKAYTEAEDRYILVLKEEEGKDWREIYAAMQDKFPEKNRSQGSIQVRYSRSLKKGASSRPKACKVKRSVTTPKLIDSASMGSSESTSRQGITLNPASVSVVDPGSIAGTTAPGPTSDGLPNTRSGRIRRTIIRPAAQTKHKDATKVAIKVNKKPKTKAANTVLLSNELDKADKALLAAAMADVSQPANWDVSRQGQPPMPNLKARLFGTSKNNVRGDAGDSRKRKRNDGNSGFDMGTTTDLPPKSPRQRLIEEMTEKERSEREAKRPRLPIRRDEDVNWVIMHPVELGKYAEDDARVAWAMKFPGPFRVLERHATRKDHVRLRALRPGELQIGPPNSDVGVWEWVGADFERLGLHRFENHPYGQSWILRSTVDGRQRRVGGDYYLVNGTARTFI